MLTPASAEVELGQFLRAVEDGTVSLAPEQEPQDVYAGNVTYIASNGWRIVIFNDANERDYIDSITTSDGRIFDLDALDAMPTVDTYEPSEEIPWTRYGIPGYCRFRCKACGTRLTKPKGGSMRPAACQFRTLCGPGRYYIVHAMASTKRTSASALNPHSIRAERQPYVRSVLCPTSMI